jgi:HPt (histidine-containing phosphotransfer) domain-containing protein
MRKSPVERIKSVPIIAMTANAMASDEARTRAAGMNAHVTKPINPERLFEVLASTVSLSGGGSPVTRKETADVTELPYEIPGLDVKDALVRLAGNRKLYRQILERFGRDYANAPQQMDDMKARRDLEGIQRLSHSLAGVAGNLGAASVYVAAKAAENAVKNGQDPDVEVNALKTSLIAVLAELSILNLPDPNAGFDSILIPSLEGLPEDLLNEMRSAVQRADIDAIEKIIERVSPLHPAAGRNLAKFAEEFDYESFRSVLGMK